MLEILLIEENKDVILLFQKILGQLETTYQLTYVHSLESAFEQINVKTFHLIFTNLFLTDSQGLDTLLEIQKRADGVPIIVIGSLGGESIAREAIHVGAQDYLPKEELSVGLLQRVIQFAIERQLLQESLKALSFTDELTSLYNRRGFITLLEQQIALSKRLKKGFYLFLIDLDYLKQINDSFGHSAGDKALISTAKCLKASFRHHDVLGRIGGDEFAAVAIYAAGESGDYLKKRLLQMVEEHNRETEEPFKLSLSIGGIYYDGLQESTVEELLQGADLELYKEKKLTHG